MGYTVHLEQGTEVRTAPSSGCGAEGKLPSGSPVVVNAVQSDTDSRHIKAIKARLNIERADISLTQKVELLEMLAGFHNVFSLSEGYSPTKKEVIEMDATETGESSGTCSPEGRENVGDGSGNLSKSPWSSPVVVVRMKDGAHKFV